MFHFILVDGGGSGGRRRGGEGLKSAAWRYNKLVLLTNPPIFTVSSLRFKLTQRPCGNEGNVVCIFSRKKVWYFDFIDLIKQISSSS